jgi:hypothetical protein
MSQPEIPSPENGPPEAVPVKINLELALTDLEDFFVDFDPDSSSTDVIAWNIFSAGLWSAVETQPDAAREMIERLAASQATYGRVLAAFSLGSLALSLPSAQHAPVQKLWATLLGDETPEVSREAAERLLTMDRDGELPPGFFRAVFARVFHATE